jgi:2-polyprenyl-3-methyl-5-hydroxy-6-metoxy-1,4-benzoquinol methylase
MSVWREHFNRKAVEHQGSPRSSDYFSDKSFQDQRSSILVWLGPQRGRRVLDAGCGVGAFSEPLARDNRVYGADLAETALGYARARGIHAVCTDLARLPFVGAGFDLVLCIGVLQHIRDDAPVLRELCASVKPGGHLVVQTLNAHSLQRMLLARVEREKHFDRLVAPDEVRRAFAAHGLDEIELLYWYYPLSLTTRSSRTTGLRTWLSTSFAIRGRRPPST